MTPIEGVLERLQGVTQNGTGHKALCPAHPDRNPSLSIDEGDDGVVLLHCFAGCSVNEIVAALGLRTADLSPPRRNGSRQREIVATYDYRDASGAVTYQTVRYRPKDFRQRHRERDGWAWNLNGVERVLYRLPELLAADPRQRVYVVEGEKDANRLVAEGLQATTHAAGAKSWPSVAAHAAVVLAGRDVTVIVDRDEAGYAWGRQVIDTLTPVVRSIETRQAVEGKDVSDHLDHGHALDALQPVNLDDEDTIDDDGPTAVADAEAERVEWLWPGRLPVGKVVIYDGDPGVGKSVVALDLAARVSSGAPFPDELYVMRRLRPPANVIILAIEDGLTDTIRPRLDAAGADLTRCFVVERLITLPGDVEWLEAQIALLEARLLVIDVLMGYLDRNLRSISDQDMRVALGPVVQMAERTGCVVLALRHPNKREGGAALYRGGGSLGIVGLSRVGLVSGYHPDDREIEDQTARRRMLVASKSNLSAIAPALTYRTVEGEFTITADGSIGKVVRVEWGEAEYMSADALLGAEGTRRPIDTAEDDEVAVFIRELVADGPVRAADVFKTGRQVGGWTPSQLRRGRRRARGVETYKVALEGGWAWRLEGDTRSPLDVIPERASSSASSVPSKVSSWPSVKYEGTSEDDEDDSSIGLSENTVIVASRPPADGLNATCPRCQQRPLTAGGRCMDPACGYDGSTP